MRAAAKLTPSASMSRALMIQERPSLQISLAVACAVLAIGAAGSAVAQNRPAPRAAATAPQDAGAAAMAALMSGDFTTAARLLRPLEREPDVAEHVSSLDMMLTLVGAGYGVGFIRATRVAASQRSDVVIRPLAMDSAVITTYLLRPVSVDMPVSAERFIARLRAHSGD